MNDSSEERHQSNRVKQRKQRPVFENLDRGRLDPVTPEVLLSARSSKRVRFDNKDWQKKLKRDSDSTQEIQLSSKRSTQKPAKQQQQLNSSNESAENQFQQISNSGHFNEFADQFYPKKQDRLSTNQKIRKQAFEPQFLPSTQTLSWQARATKEGFIYFLIPGTNTFQWQFPTYFDSKSRKKKHCFLENWTAKSDDTGHTYYINKITKFCQDIKPDTETYVLQASMVGNIAFIELYLSVQGDLGIEDQRGRNSLHQSVGNGHQQLSQILCEFGKMDNLIERTDKYGCTPLFSAIRYNQANCVVLLLQYNCNIFHRNKKGDTCLHYAALHNAADCLTALGQYCSEQLIKTRNKDGLRAVEVAEHSKHFACKNALHLLERNITYQNALLLRDKGLPSNSTRKIVNDPISARSQLSKRLGGEPLRNPNVKKFEEDETSSEEAAEAPKHLQYDSHYQRTYTDRDKTHKANIHELEYKQQNRKDQNTERMAYNREPRFTRKLDPVPSHRATFQDSKIQESYFDEEINGRVSKSARQRIRSDKYDLYAKDRDKPTVFEKAYFGLTQVGSFFKTQVSNIVEYVYSDAQRQKSSRSRKRVLNTDDEVLPMPKGISSRRDYDSETFNSARDDLQSSSQVYQKQEQSSGSEHYKTTYDRSQSRPATAQSKSRQRNIIETRVDPPPRSARVESSLKRDKSGGREENYNLRPPIIVQQRAQGKVVNQQAEIIYEKSIEMRSICIQASPPKRIKKHKKTDVSKHSVGVGSMRIDETTMPLQDNSQTYIEPNQSSQSRIVANKAKKQKQIKLGNQNRNLIQKRYQSEEEDKQRVEDSKNFSPSPQPKFMKPEVMVMRNIEKLGQAFGKDVPRIQQAARKPVQQTNQSDQLTLSYNSVSRAPILLTNDQKDILNLRGHVSSNPNSGYKLQVEEVKIMPVVSMSEQRTKSKPVDEQIKDFYARLASEVSSDSSLAAPTAQQKNSAEEVYFMPEEQDEENYQFQNENFNHYQNSSSDSVLFELEKENFENLSDPSFVPNKNLFKFGNQSAASVDRGHLIQSTSTHSIANFSIQNSSLLKPLKILTSYPQSDSEGPSRPKKFLVPLPKKKDAKHLDLFSEDSEKKRLRNLSANGSEAATVKSKKPDDDHVFYGIDSPKSSEKEEEEEQNAPQIAMPKLALTSQDRTSSKGGQNRYESLVEDELINFDITQEVTQTLHIDVEVARNTTTLVEHILANEVLPEQKLEIRSTYNKGQQAFSNINQAQIQSEEVNLQQVRDEIDNISSLFDGLKEESTLIGQLVEPLLEKQESTDILGELMRKPRGYASSSAEEEIKHNRSTAFQFKNNFMSSDEDRIGDSARRLENVTSIASGNRSARNKQRKSVKDVQLRSKQTAVDQSQISEKTSQSVADRLKQSMASFKSNKLTSERDKNKSMVTSTSRQIGLKKDTKTTEKIVDAIDQVQSLVAKPQSTKMGNNKTQI